jgi:hypothetical protein
VSDNEKLTQLLNQIATIELVSGKGASRDSLSAFLDEELDVVCQRPAKVHVKRELFFLTIDGWRLTEHSDRFDQTCVHILQQLLEVLPDNEKRNFFSPSSDSARIKNVITTELILAPLRPAPYPDAPHPGYCLPAFVDEIRELKTAEELILYRRKNPPELVGLRLQWKTDSNPQSRAAIKRIYQQLRDNGSWPTARSLEMYLNNLYPNGFATIGAMHSLLQITRPISDDTKAKLWLAGLLFVPDARKDVDLIVSMFREVAPTIRDGTNISLGSISALQNCEQRDLERICDILEAQPTIYVDRSNLRLANPFLIAKYRDIERLEDVLTINATDQQSGEFQQGLSNGTAQISAATSGPTLDSTDESLWPKLIGQYQGDEGNDAHVWKARDRFDRPVAVKVFKPGRDALEVIVGHGARLAKIKHPNVVTVHGVSPVRLPTGEQKIGLVMEWIEGVNLGVHLEKNPVSAEEFVRWSRSLISAVQAFHAANIDHRDLDVRNVMIADKRELIVIDAAFTGSSKAANQQTSTWNRKLDLTNTQGLILSLREQLKPDSLKAIAASIFDQLGTKAVPSFEDMLAAVQEFELASARLGH